LVVYWDDHNEVIPLQDGVALVLGRSKPADIVVPEGKLSRSHARFTSLEEGVKVEDLGSTNGTHHRGARIKSVLLAPGDSVTMGRVTVSVNRAEGRANLLGDVVSYLDFRERLRNEIVRTRTFRRGVAVMCVRAVPVPGGGGDTHVSTWVPAVRAALRPVDRMALSGPSAAFLLIPETDEDRARVVAEGLLGLDERLVVGAALHGSSAAELVDAARRCARAAHVDERLVLHSHDALAGVDEPLFASPQMIELEELLERVSRSRIPVLITGETGSGKEVVAQAIHRRGPRATGPMLVVNCATMSDAHVQTALFGHEKGAFEGATERREGLLEKARGGTLLLDEVSELGIEAQAMLLRVLESQVFQRVGGDEAIELDARILAATNRDLTELVAREAFRRDLLFRLNAIAIHVPPLRDRAGDIDPLVDRFLREASVANGARVEGIEEEARAALRAHRWTGNVRELRNCLERAVVACTVTKVRLEDLPVEVRGVEPEAEPTRDEGIIDLRAEVRAHEQRLLLDALRRAQGDGKRAAELLSIPLRTLVRKVGTHELGEHLNAPAH